METLKAYLPWIIVGAIVLYLLTKLRSNVGLAPQTQFTETQQTDPLAQLRGEAFTALTQAGIEESRLSSALEGIRSQLQLGLAGEETRRQAQQFQRETAHEENVFGRDLRAQLQLIQQNLGLERLAVEREQLPLQIDLAKYLQESQLAFNRFAQESYLKELQLYLAQREQDRQLQQSAIDRYYDTRSSGTTGQIISSISQAVQSIFGGRSSGNVFGTPPTFPGFGGLF